MDNLLAIDTTTDTCRVALVGRDWCLEHTRFTPRLHNAHVLAMVDSVLGGARQRKADVDAIAYSGGPASFTGVRIAGAVAQGLGLALNARVIAVPSSEIAAETMRLATGVTGDWRIARLARRGWRYVARYRFTAVAVDCLNFDELVPEARLGADVVDVDRFPASARVVASLARRRGSTAPTTPYYVAGDSPWRPLTNR